MVADPARLPEGIVMCGVEIAKSLLALAVPDKASITLTSAGKILLRGAYILNRSSGVNRIKGGSVQIN